MSFYPKVLVLMSTYNGEKYVRRQIDSLLQQSNVEVSILIRDDGSNDRTIAIINELKICYDNIELIEGNNIGACKSFLELIYASKDFESYNYVAFSDQDDIWQTEKLSEAIKLLQKTQAPTLYYSALNMCDNITNKEMLKINKYEPVLYETLISSQYPGCTMVMNHNGFKELRKNPKPHSAIMHDLFVVQIFLLNRFEIIYDKNSYINYQIHGNNVSVAKKGIIASLKRYLRIALSQKNYRLEAARELMQYIPENISKVEYEKMFQLVNYKKSFKDKYRTIKNIMSCRNSMRKNMMFAIAVIFNIF